MGEHITLLRKNEDEHGVDEYLAYAKLRGPRQLAFMLELRTHAGNGQALDYGWLSRARFDPSAGIVLHFAGVTVTIRGRKLRPLYEAILTHRATWIQELTTDTLDAARDPEETLVSAILIDPP